MSKGYIKIGSMYITVWRLLYWAAFSVSVFIASPLLVIYYFVFFIHVVFRFFTAKLYAIRGALNESCVYVITNRLTECVVNIALDNHLKAMPWKQDKDNDL